MHTPQYFTLTRPNQGWHKPAPRAEEWLGTICISTNAITLL